MIRHQSRKLFQTLTSFITKPNRVIFSFNNHNPASNSYQFEYHPNTFYINTLNLQEDASNHIESSVKGVDHKVNLVENIQITNKSLSYEINKQLKVKAIYSIKIILLKYFKSIQNDAHLIENDNLSLFLLNSILSIENDQRQKVNYDCI